MQSCLDSDDKGFCMFFSDNLLKYVFLGAKRLRYIVRKNGLNSLKAIITSPPTSHLVKLSLPNINLLEFALKFEVKLPLPNFYLFNIS